MKIRLLFKTPDVTDQINLGILDEQTAAGVRAIIAKFLVWEECITVEFDTEAQTATVIEQ